ALGLEQNPPKPIQASKLLTTTLWKKGWVYEISGAAEIAPLSLGESAMRLLLDPNKKSSLEQKWTSRDRMNCTIQESRMFKNREILSCIDLTWTALETELKNLLPEHTLAFLAPLLNGLNRMVLDAIKSATSLHYNELLMRRDEFIRCMKTGTPESVKNDLRITPLDRLRLVDDATADAAVKDIERLKVQSDRRRTDTHRTDSYKAKSSYYKQPFRPFGKSRQTYDTDRFNKRQGRSFPPRQQFPSRDKRPHQSRGRTPHRGGSRGRY
ncbi:MAG: hypothetical protein AAFO91_01910, partial [Bacteroidota bacterium]